MKVAYTFVSMPVGGAEDFAISVSRHLPKEWEPTFVCLRSLGVVGEELLGAGIPTHLVPVAKTKRLSLLGIWKLSRWFKAHEVAVVHSQTYHSHIYALPAAWLAGVHAVLHQQKTLEPMKWHRELLMRLAVRASSKIVTLSEKTRIDFQRHFHLPANKVAVVPNVIDFQTFHPAPNSAEAKRAVGLDPELPAIGGIASLTEVKNHSLTIEMLRRVKDKAIPFQALLLGEGKTRAALTQQIAESGLTNHLQLPGAKRPVTPWLQALDVLVLPSTWEGQPMVLLQAIACGVPIVASRIEGNVAVLGDHPGLFDVNRVEDYAAKVEKVLRDHTFRDRVLSHQAQLRASLVSAEDGAKTLAQIYDSMTA